ncbi:hypothetical protein RSAG8_13707, partial [Rhizoctonia solani AG-8 WAC10335]
MFNARHIRTWSFSPSLISHLYLWDVEANILTDR